MSQKLVGQEHETHNANQVRRLPKRAALLAAAAAAISVAHARSAEAATPSPAQKDSNAAQEFLASAKRAPDRPGITVRGGEEIVFTNGPQMSVTNGDLTTTASFISNPLPIPGAARTWARIALHFETQDGPSQTIYVNTPTTWEVGDLENILSTRDSKYAFLVFERCVVVAIGFSSALAGETTLAIERNGESIELASNSFHFMLPEDSQGQDLFAYANSDSSFAFLNTSGILRLSPLDVEGNFLRTDIGAPEEGTRLLFARGLLFVVRPAQNCITAFDSRLDSSPFKTAEQLSGAPSVVYTGNGFETTFTTASGSSATYKAVVQSEGILSSFVAMQLQPD